MKRSLNLIFLLTPLLCISQQKQIDSLTTILKSQTALNENRLNSLIELSYHYSSVDPNQGLTAADEAIALSKQLNLKEQQARAYKYKGQNYHATSQDSLAILMYNKAVVLQKELNHFTSAGKTIFNTGLIYFGQSQYAKADQCNKEAFAIFKKEKDSTLMAVVLNSMGINQMYRSLYPEALDTYLRAKKIYEGRKDTNNKIYAGILSNLGILYSRLEKPEQALDYYNQGLKLCRQLNFEKGIANALTGLGNVYDNKNEPKIALGYYNESYQIMERINNLYGIASALSNIGITQINLKNYDEAVNQLKNCIPYFEKLENTYNLAVVHQNIGIALKDNPTSKREQFLKAKSHFQQALSYAKEINSIQLQSNILKFLSQLRVKLRDYKTAYSEYTEAIILRDSFLSLEKKEEIAKLEAQYNYQKKEAVLKATHNKEQDLKEEEIKRQRLIKNTSIFGGSGIILASIIGFILYRRKQDAVSKSKEAAFNAKVSDTELKALRSQMNPHFIFNSLNSIGDYILKNDTQSASDYLSKFAKLMRLTLENSEKKEILLSEDITLLKTYMEIERKRFKNKFNYTIDIDSGLDAENILVPPMILQPFIENSIIHGLSQKEGIGAITIAFKAHNNMLMCSVEDNGVGRQNSTSNITKKSMGMAITKSRIEIINKLKNTNGSVEIVDKSQGTQINVSLPMQLAF